MNENDIEIEYTSDGLQDICQLFFKGGIGLTGFWAMLAAPLFAPLWWILLMVSGGGMMALGKQIMSMTGFEFAFGQKQEVVDDGNDEEE